MGKLFVISAPSGTGKTSLIKSLLEDPMSSNTKLGISCTTREKRPKEKDGISYFFFSEDNQKSCKPQNIRLFVHLIRLRRPVLKKF